jgi:hypothetical protein
MVIRRLLLGATNALFNGRRHGFWLSTAAASRIAVTIDA